jgi:hypothetical protein
LNTKIYHHAATFSDDVNGSEGFYRESHGAAIFLFALLPPGSAVFGGTYSYSGLTGAGTQKDYQLYYSGFSQFRLGFQKNGFQKNGFQKNGFQKNGFTS